MKDIAVLNGQTARFECIVQCDPHPYIEWYRNETPIRNGMSKHFTEFRNGVCRLIIPETVSSKYTTPIAVKKIVNLSHFTQVEYVFQRFC